MVCETVNSTYLSRLWHSTMTKNDSRRRVEPREGEFQEGFPAYRPDLAYVVLDDRKAAIEAFLAQSLEDLLCAVRVRLQQTNHSGLEGVEPTPSWCRMPAPVLRTVCPLGHRVRMQAEGPRRLGDGQSLSLLAILDLAVGLVIDHGARPRAARNWPIRRLIASAPSSRAATGWGTSRASTW